ncbi:hypothetical protein D3C80_1484840 [compost metagenome]
MAARGAVDRGDLQVAIVHGQLTGRGDDIDAVRLYGRGIRYLQYRHCGIGLDDLVGDAFVIRREVKDDDKCHAGVTGHLFEEGFQCRKPTGRCADTHHWKAQVTRQDAFSLRQ